MVLVGTRYTLNEKQRLTTSMLLKRVMDTPSGEGVGYQTSVSDPIHILHWRIRRDRENTTN